MCPVTCACKTGLTCIHDLHVISIYSNLLLKPPISCDVYIPDRLSGTCMSEVCPLCDMWHPVMYIFLDHMLFGTSCILDPLISRLTYMCYIVPIFIILLVIFVKFGCQCLLSSVFCFRKYLYALLD